MVVGRGGQTTDRRPLAIVCIKVKTDKREKICVDKKCIFAILPTVHKGGNKMPPESALLLSEVKLSFDKNAFTTDQFIGLNSFQFIGLNSLSSMDGNIGNLFFILGDINERIKELGIDGFCFFGEDYIGAWIYHSFSSISKIKLFSFDVID